MEPIDDTTLLLLLAPLVVIELVGKVTALISVAKAKPEAVRGPPRGAWVAIVLLVNFFGWLAWFLVGRKPR